MSLRRLLYLVVIVLLLGVVANDVIRYFATQRQLTADTYALVAYAAGNRLSAPRDEVAAELVTIAEKNGIRVMMYGQSAQGAEIWTETDVTGTYFIGPIYNMVLGKDLATALKEPLVISSYRVAGPH